MDRHVGTGCSLDVVFFPWNFVIFLNSANSAAVKRENGERPESGLFFQFLGRDTAFGGHPVSVCLSIRHLSVDRRTDK